MSESKSTSGLNSSKRNWDSDSDSGLAGTSRTVSKRRKSGTTIGHLPDEMLEEILSYLEHGDRLVARQVCGRWNKVLTSWSGFMDSVVLVVHSFELLIKTGVAWRSLVVNGDVITELTPVFFSKDLRSLTESVTGLVLNEVTWSWGSVQDFITSFRHLDKLALINCSGPIATTEGWFQTPEEVTRFIELRKRIKELKLENRGLTEINFYLKKLTDYNSSLKALELTVNVFSTEDTSYRIISPGITHFRNNLLGFMDACKTTLRSLKLSVHYGLISSACFTLRGLNVRLTTFSMAWTNQPDVRDISYAESLDEEAILAFVKTQSDLTCLDLPPLRLGAGIDRKLVPALPSGLQSLSMVPDKILSVRLCQKMMSVKNLSAKFPRHLNRFPFGTTGTVFPELNSLYLEENTNLLIIAPLLQTSFPNLLKLSIMQENPVVDREMQTIISSLPNLNTLICSPCDTLTDYGITGIRERDRLQLLSTRTVYLGDQLDKLGVVPVGPSLSSLKGLKKVCLLNGGPGSGVSDVGIQYGFNLPGLRVLEFHGCAELSDWGLTQLGKLNPGLEEVSLTINDDNGRTTDAVIRRLRKSLQRIPERKFRVNVQRHSPIVAATETLSSDYDSEPEPDHVWPVHLNNVIWY